MGTLVVDASRHGNPRVEFYGPREEDQGAFAGGEKVSRGDRGAADRAAVLKVIQNAPGGSMDPVRQVLAAVKIAELNIPREHVPALLDELVQLGDLTADNGVRNSTSYDSNPLHERLHDSPPVQPRAVAPVRLPLAAPEATYRGGPNNVCGSCGLTPETSGHRLDCEAR